LEGVVTTGRGLLGSTEAKHLVLAQDLGEENLFAKPNIFCHFTQGIGDPKYFPVTDVAQLNKLLKDVLDSYNEVNAVMNLVRSSGARPWPAQVARTQISFHVTEPQCPLSTQTPSTAPGGHPCVSFTHICYKCNL
jgi:hypothetical protein